MKRRLFILLLIPLLTFSHIRDERMFKSVGVPSSALVLLDRSGSMDGETQAADALVRCNDYWYWSSWPPRSTHLEGWYDSEITPDGPGSMDDFNGFPARGFWGIVMEWNRWGYNRVDFQVILKVKSNGSWHTEDLGWHSWSGWGYFRDFIFYDSTDDPWWGNIEDVEWYFNVTTRYGLRMRDIRFTVAYARDYLYSTRIKDAILVFHSILDVDKDGIIEDEDEDLLPVIIGQGFHRESKPGDVFLPDGDSYYDDDLGYAWNQYTENWDNVGSGTMYTDGLGSSFTDIWDHIKYTDVGGYTPNGLLIARAVDYYNDWRRDNPDLWCMACNIILITDGESNQPREECGDGARDLVRQTYRAWHEDSIRVYTVAYGDGIDESATNEMNWASRWGGTQFLSDSMIGEYVDAGMDTNAVDGSTCSMSNPQSNFLTGYTFMAEDIEALSSALERVFMDIASQENMSYASGEVTSVEEEFLSTEYQARLFFASFNPDTLPIWEGDLKAVKLDTGEFILDSIPPEIIIWAAGDSLKVDQSADARNIYGVKSNGDMLSFNASNFSATDLNVLSSEVADVIDRVRDGLKDDNKGELGDIFHSSPQRIHLPNYFFIDQGFDQFYTQMKDRSPLLYVGANDGMLHIFADSINGQSGRGGEEIMGIIPMNFVPEVQHLLDEHNYYVDGDPAAADIWFPTDGNDSLKQGSEWHTILIATQGEGGRSFTVLDITDPLGETSHSMDSIAFLFSAMQSSLLQDTLGYTSSTPTIHKVGVNWTGHPNRTIDRFFAFMGGGQWPDPMDISLLDSVFSAGEVEGNVIISFDVWKAKEEGISGNVNLIPPIGRDAGRMNVPFPATPSMVNVDPEKGNRYDCLFIPDAYGQLWFVDVTNPNPSAWKAECVFIPPLPSSSDSSELSNWHPAFYRPLVWKDPIYGDYWVAYGTGNRSDVFIPSEDRFYALRYPDSAIVDTSIAIPVYGEGDLGTPGSPTGAGWKLTLQHTNEKVVTQPIYYLDSLKFFTFSTGTDTTLSPCEIGGLGAIARSYTFDIRSGGTAVIGGTVEGTGMPQPPRYSYSLGGTGMEITQVGGKIKIEKSKSYISYKEIVKWKEE